MSICEYSHLGKFAHLNRLNGKLFKDRVQNFPNVSTHSYSSAFLKCMLPKRRFWKTEQRVGRVFSRYFARV